jgi:hypothetical protein
MFGSLEARFIEFLSTFPGAESIDSCMESSAPDLRKRADFMLWNRRAVVEIKTLKSDPSQKVDTEMAKHQACDDFPLCYGIHPLQKILGDLPDGQSINQKIWGAITRSIEGDVRSAEKQIAQTEKIFHLANPVRMLVLLNESIDILSPEIAGHRVAKLMLRARSDQPGAPTLDVAWLIFESHVVKVTSDLNGFVSLRIDNPSLATHSWFDSNFDTLQMAWVNRNYGAFATAKLSDPNALGSMSSAEEKAKNHNYG